jgi:ketosteroid isomerase-like protein
MFTHDQQTRRLSAVGPRSAALAVLLAAGLVSCRSAGPVEVATEPFPEAQKEIERTLDELLKTTATKDFARLEAMHLYGPKFSRWDSVHPGRLDAEATRRFERAVFEPLDTFRASVEDLKVDVFGPAAVTTLVMPYEGTAAGKTVRGKARATLVWVKTESGWKIAHEHLSPVPAAP